MAYLEVHQSLRDHRKVLELAGVLDIPETYVVGRLLYLWLWALDNSRGDSLPSSAKMIERMAGWSGPCGVFVGGMVQVGLLDEADDGSLWIHDWMQYAGKIIRRLEANAERGRLTDVIRQWVVERDGYRCGICGETVDREDVHIDHVVPVSRGGKSTLENLRVTHSTCNLAKGARMPMPRTRAESESEGD